MKRPRQPVALRRRQRGFIVNPYTFASAGPSFASLLHFDGADGDTSMIDESGLIWTPSGDAQLDTSQAMFGPSSLLLDGAGDWVDATADARFTYGTGDYTIEAFARLAAITGNHFIFGFGLGWGIYALTVGGGEFAVFNGIASNVLEGGSAVTNTWYHIAMCRKSGVLRAFIDGVSLGGTADTTNHLTTNFRIGAQTSGSGNFNGWIDEVRLQPPGVALYTANFTPPAAPFT